MSKNATRITNALNKSMDSESAFATSYGSLVTVLDSVIKAKDFSSIESVMWDLADDTSTTAGNPYHKLGSTLRNRTKVKCSIKLQFEKNEDGDKELVGVEVKRKSKATKQGTRGASAVEPSKAREQFIAAMSKRTEEWLSALLKMDAATMRNAVLAAKRHAA